MARQHKHTPKTHGPRIGREYPWTHCVTPEECNAHPQKQVAHGNVLRVDTCTCGATRESEHNGFKSNYGPWVVLEVSGE